MPAIEHAHVRYPKHSTTQYTILHGHLCPAAQSTTERCKRRDRERNCVRIEVRNRKRHASSQVRVGAGRRTQTRGSVPLFAAIFPSSSTGPESVSARVFSAPACSAAL